MRLTAAQSVFIGLLATAINIYIRVAAWNEYYYCLGEAVTFVLLLLVIIGRDGVKTKAELYIYEFILVLTMLNVLDELLREALTPTLRELVVSFAVAIILVYKLARIVWRKYKLKT